MVMQQVKLINDRSTSLACDSTERKHLSPPELQRLRDVCVANCGGSFDVGDGARHLQHKVIAPRTEAECIDGPRQPCGTPAVGVDSTS